MWYSTALVNYHTKNHSCDTFPHLSARLAEAGVSMDEIAQYLGHSDIRITSNTYARYSPEHLQKAATALEFDFAC
ncbi:tyrosine-type recombinase/integrase [Natronohydrobacter thiooxidans]|uniref:tyrosine-type recombinase/integrase n=1 Tax=Natronohydrobacter thiooxidans TaxID=87172 RepID=UPI003CCC33AA